MAVFVRTYDWGSFAARAALRTFAHASSADCFILADETRSGPIGAPLFRKIGHAAGDFASLGLPTPPSPGSPLWWNCDYGFYDAYLKCPGYDTYMFVEDDVAVNLPLSDIAQGMTREGFDWLTFRGHRKITPTWTHHMSCSDLPYAEKSWTPLTVVCATGQALGFLLSERRRMAEMYAAGTIRHWAFCEGFAASALRSGGRRIGDLRRFANMEHFGTTSAYLEDDPRVRAPGSLAHAVLEPERYARKFFTRTLEDLLSAGHYNRIAEARTELAAAGLARFEEWQVRPASGNMALDRPATQSSVSKWSRHIGGRTLDPAATDARGANCGVLTDRHGFHTAIERHPWWAVDLERVETIREVRIYQAARRAGAARHLSLQICDDGRTWREVYRKRDDRVFTGPDAPLICRLPEPVRGRHLRVMLDGTGPLHLAEVEVYGPT